MLSSKEIQAPCGSLFNFSVNNHKVPVRWTVDARCRQCSQSVGRHRAERQWLPEQVEKKVQKELRSLAVT